MNEKQLERKCCKWAEARGWTVLKFVSPNNRGVPDRLFLKAGEAVFVEFKQPGGRTRPEQQRWIHKLYSLHFRAYIVSDFDVFTEVLDADS